MSKQQPDLFALLGRPTITPQAQKGTWNYTPPARGESSGQEYIEFAKSLGVGADALLRASIGKLRKQKSKAEEIGGAAAIAEMKKGYGNLAKAMRNYANKEGIAHGDNPFVPKEFLKMGGRLAAHSPDFRNFMLDGIQDTINNAATNGYTPEEFDYELDGIIGTKLDEFSKELPQNENARKYGFDPAAISVVQKLRTGWASQFKARLSSLAVERIQDTVTQLLKEPEVSNKVTVDAYFGGDAIADSHFTRHFDTALVNVENHPPDDDMLNFLSVYKGHVMNNIVGDIDSPNLVENLNNAILDVKDMAAVRLDRSNARMDEGKQSQFFADLKGRLVGQLGAAEARQAGIFRASQVAKEEYWGLLAYTCVDQVTAAVGMGQNSFITHPQLFMSVLMTLGQRGELVDPSTGNKIVWRPKEEGKGGHFIEPAEGFNPFRDPVYDDNYRDVNTATDFDIDRIPATDTEGAENDFSPPLAVYQDTDKASIFAAIAKALPSVNTTRSQRQQTSNAQVKLNGDNFEMRQAAIKKEILGNIKTLRGTKGKPLTREQVNDEVDRNIKLYATAIAKYKQPWDLPAFREGIYDAVEGNWAGHVEDAEDREVNKRLNILDAATGEDLEELVKMDPLSRLRHFTKKGYTKEQSREVIEILDKAGTAYFKNRKVDIGEARIDSTFNRGKTAILMVEVDLAPYFAGQQEAAANVGGIQQAGLKSSVGSIMMMQQIKIWLDKHYVQEYDKMARHYGYDMKKVESVMDQHFTRLDPDNPSLKEGEGAEEVILFEKSLALRLLHAPANGALGINPKTKTQFETWLEYAQYQDLKAKTK